MGTATERSSISSMTSTSHTMTAFPPPIMNGHSLHSKASPHHSNLNPYEMLIASLQPENRYSFLTPAREINDAAVKCAKNLLDGPAGKIYDEQKSRLEAKRQEGKGKRKRGPDISDGREALKIRKIVTEGFETNHIWEQTRRVIDALRGEVEREFEGLEVEDEEESENDFLTEEENNSNEESVDEEIEDEEDEEGESEEELDDEQLAALEAIEAGSDMDEDMDELEDEKELGDDDQDDDEEPTDIYVEDAHGLNDGFFSIDHFNKQTEFLEQQDALADPYTGEASDEEEIDWDADPVTNTQIATSTSRRKQAMDITEEEEEEEEEEEGNGPTFGNADLNAPFSDDDEEKNSDAEMDEDPNSLGTNTNDVLYADFFEPPARKASKGDRQASYLSRQATKSKLNEEEAATELERAQASQHRDLFDDESVSSDSEASELDPGDPQSRKSSHERRQAKLLAEIQRLEAASVEKRDWTLRGEAKASDREKNSLTFLEEELDFERTGKPVPVITAEVSESIEELIKRRILAREFDEVVKRRPDSLSSGENIRRGAFELSDEKSAKGLGELYAEDHVKKTFEAEGETYVSASDEKLKKQQDEIKSLWKEVEGKLDALSSWHYRPRPSAPAITVVSDIATVRMEDAQPSTGMGIGAGAESMLAPQEIYKAGKDQDGQMVAEGEEKNREVIRGGVPVARGEMTREEKLRRRRREKERIRKSGGEVPGGRNGNAKPQSKKAAEKKEVVGQLKKGGVMVINRKGEVVDVAGNKVAQKGMKGIGGGGFKL